MYMLSSLAREKRTQQEGLTVRYTRDSLGCLHNSYNGVSVRAYGLSPLGVRQKKNRTHSVSSVFFVVLPPQG